ncbi:MAG: tripartite tricarboxylate transporter substrate binding protein [Burkholderiales bacterium]|nr:tripartite tricarboxylate transporter substrate binding protein [Burkholderiales bacterium]
MRALLYSLLPFLLTVAPFAAAQDYPTRPIRLIVPAPPGGSTNQIGRLVGSGLSEVLGEQAVVDNRGGAGGIVGTDILAKAPADGYTIGVVYTTHSVNPSLHKTLPFDSIKDFSTITIAATAPLVLVVNPSLAVHSIKDLVGLAKVRPLSYGSAGNGSGGHLSGELLKIMTGINAVHVPYKGASPATADVVAGHLQYQFAAEITTKGFIESGRLRAIAVTSLKRAPSMPDVPTVAESGVPDFEVINWFGFLAPANTPDAILTRLNTEIVKILHRPNVTKVLNNSGAEVVGSTRQEFAAFLVRDIAKWVKVVKMAGMKVD